MTQRALQRGLTATPIRGATDWPALACEPAGDTLPNLRSMQHSTVFLYLSSFEALRIIFNAFGPTFCAETQPCPVFRKKDATLSGHSIIVRFLNRVHEPRLAWAVQETEMMQGASIQMANLLDIARERECGDHAARTWPAVCACAGKATVLRLLSDEVEVCGHWTLKQRTTVLLELDFLNVKSHESPTNSVTVRATKRELRRYFGCLWFARFQSVILYSASN